MAYLNAAGAGLPDPAVHRRMIAHLSRALEIGDPAAEAEAAEEVARIRPRLAALIGAETDELAFLDWGTLAWNAAILSLPVAGRRVLCAPGEWSSNVALLQRLGAQIEVMATDATGKLDVPAIAARMGQDLAAICLPLVCSLTGERYPVEAIGALDRPESCFLVVDISQAVAQMPVDMGALGADIVAAPARKWLRGPKGTGFLAVRRAAMAHLAPSRVADDGRLSWPDGIGLDCADATRFEKLGFNAALRLGLGAALDVHLADATGIQGRLAQLAGHVRGRAARLGVSLAGAEMARSAITTLRGPADMIGQLAARAREAGHVVKLATPDCEPLRPAATVSGGFLRIAPHVYNTEAEIDALFDLFAAAA